ncbi:MAG TPA: HesA/MoeB/ThiF family protein [Opitutaceae bacterium]|jgi:molybdopterin/thiamine biosynthesis adenylyltransferase/rhodanese-related sulfurtransferase|nr:HesA/MoeB/ThiF family protein [Opitutaceae bacterium]
MSFSPEELQRYQRHLSLAGFGPEAQEKLKRGSVLVIGAGGLGCPALLYLAAAGVGRIVIVDDDRVEVSNLQRQVLYTSDDAGELKVEAAARRLRALNPLIVIEPRAERFTRANALELVRDCDVVLDGSDNFATRYLVNDACVLAGRPFVYGAIQGFEGQLSVFNWRDGPTYRCLFPEPPAPGTVPNCAEAGVLGVLPGLIGTAQACEVIKLLTGIGEPLSGRLLLWNALTTTMQSVSLVADPRSRDIREFPPEGYGETCATPAGGPEEIDVAALRAALDNGHAPQLIDVRETWERVRGSIEPSVHVPLGELGENAVDALAALDPAMPIVVYCAAGVRSLHGAKLLRERHGFPQAVSLRGGYHAWLA